MLRLQLAPIYGNLLLDRAEIKIRSVPWRMTPPKRQEPTVNPSRGTGDVAPGTLLHSGEMTLTEADLVVRRRGFPFSLVRTYRSQTLGSGVLGPGWTHGYEASLRFLPDHSVELYDGRGRVERFELETQLVERDGETRTAASWRAPRGRFLELFHPEENVWIVIDERARKLTFDGFGRLVSISDVLAEGQDSGNQMRFQYDSHSRLIGVIDTLGEWYDFEYDAEGRLARIIDPESRTVEYSYDALGRLVSVRSPLITVGDSAFPSGLVRQYEYTTPVGGYAEQLQTRDNLTAVIDPRGRRWLELVYTDADADGYANEVTGQTWGGHSLQIAYDFATRRTTVTDRRQNVCTYDHNHLGQVTAITDPVGAVTTFEYNYDGLLTRQVNPLGGVIENVYEAGKTRRSRSNLLQVVVRPDSRGANGSSEELITTRGFEDRTNQVLQTVHPWGATSLAERDDYGRATRVTEAAASAEETSVQFEYNSYGQPTRAVNPNGHVVEYTYSEDGYLETETVDPGGLDLVSRYETDERGNVTARIDPRGVRHEYVYNEVDWLVEERLATTGSNDGAPALSYVTRYLYDENGNVIETKVPFGDGTTTSVRSDYGILNEVTAVESEIVAGGAFTRETREYDENFNLIKVTDPEGHVTELTYEPRNLLETRTRGAGTPEASTVSYIYDAERQVVVMEDGRQQSWTTAYDGYGRLETATDPLGNFATRTYDGAGNVTGTESHGASEGLLASQQTEYDLLNRPTTLSTGHWFQAESHPDIASSVVYDPASNVISATDPRDFVTLTELDAAERPARRTDPMGNMGEATYDATGNVIQQVDTEQIPDGSSVPVSVAYTYDALGRVVERIESDGRRWQTEYDARGNVTKEIDPELNTTTYEHDGLNRVTRMKRPEGIAVDYTYDADSRLISYRDALSQTTTYEYDALERQTKVTYADLTVETTTYDGNDNAIELVDARGNVAQTFDGADRLISRSITLAAGIGGITAESFAYDGLNRLTSAVSGVTVTRDYDSLSRLRTETIDGNTVAYEYDDASNVSALVYPSQVAGQPYRVSYQNDGLNRRSQISSPGGTVAEYAYRGRYLRAKKWLFGAASLLAFQGDLSHDPTRRLLSQQYVRASDSVSIFDESLAWYDRNLKSSSIRADLDGRQLSYSYDGADRVIDVERQEPVAQCENGLPTRWAYAYDTADNLLAKTEERDTCQAQKVVDLPLDGTGRNRPGAVGENQLTWDASGNLTGKGGLGLEYDYRDRLIRAETSSGAYDYVYDHFNRRVRKTGGGKVEKTVWSGWQAIESYVDDQLAERRIFGPGMDEIVRIENIESNAAYLPVYDDTGNLALVTDETGEPVERYEYSPFGERFIFADTSPPEIEQVRLNNGEVWLEISEYVDGDALQQGALSGELRLRDLDLGTELPITVTQPVTTGRQGGRRIVITTVPIPVEGTNIELVVPGSALVDQAEQEATADYIQAFQWVASDLVLDDVVAPRLDTVCVQGDHLEIQFSEEPDLAQIDQVLQVDGVPRVWALGADGYTVVSEPLGAGSHTVSVLGGVALDLAGFALGTGLTKVFEISASTPENLVLFDRPREAQLASSAIDLLYGFHGRPIDPETGLVYFRNRYYDPDLGRFVTTDPLGYADSPNLYQFALNDPINLSDPTGEFVILGGLAIAAAAIYGATEEIERATDIDPHAHLGVSAAVGGLRGAGVAGVAVATAGFGGGLAAGLGGGLIAQGTTAGAFAGAGAIFGEDLIDAGIRHRREFSSFGRYAGAAVFGGVVGGVGGALVARYPRLGAPVFRTSIRSATNVPQINRIARSSVNLEGAIDRTLISRAASRVRGVSSPRINLAPASTARQVMVTSWADRGITPDLSPGRFVMLGGKTRWNFSKAGLKGPKLYPAKKWPFFKMKPSKADFDNAISDYVPESSLEWPRPLADRLTLKGLLGQRQIKGGS